MIRNTFTILVDKPTIEKMRKLYQECIVENENEYLDFFAKNENCSISVYKSGKVVFQGNKAIYEASIWEPEIINAPLKDNEFTFEGSHAGSDEVGTGDFFGPIIVVAAYVDEKYFNTLTNLGVKDSKKLTDQKIKIIGHELLKFIPYSHLRLNNEKYNEMVEKGYNMNKLKAYLHNKALINLEKKLNKKIEYSVIDQFTPENLYYAYLKDEIIVEKNIKFITKGEIHSIAVAAASIIARYSFLICLEKIEKEYQIKLLKGASKQVDARAKEIYKKIGKDNFRKIAKLNFKNYERLES